MARLHGYVDDVWLEECFIEATNEEMGIMPTPTKRTTAKKTESKPSKADRIANQSSWPEPFRDIVSASRKVTICSRCSNGCYLCGYSGLVMPVSKASISAYIQQVGSIKNLEKKVKAAEKAAEPSAEITVNLNKLPQSDGKPKGTAPIYKDKTAGFWMKQDGEWRRVSRVAIPKVYTPPVDPQAKKNLESAKKELARVNKEILTFESVFI